MAARSSSKRPSIRPSTRLISILFLTGAVVSVPATASRAQEQNSQTQDAAPQIEPQPSTDAGFYCKNIADKAKEARLAWQTWKLVGLETKLKERIQELTSTKEELKTWVERREKLLGEVEDQVVAIIARMRPDAAAAQLATSDDDTAIGVLLKLKARAASEILDEMEPARAAQLTQLMVSFSASAPERSF